jgi:CrcB protein
MSLIGLIVVGGGAAAGAWLRWWFGAAFNQLFPTLPLGTLAANLTAGFLLGISTELFVRQVEYPPEVRLLVVTGFLGGLSTFSTFASEAVILLARKEYWWGAAHAAMHVAGTIGATVLGIFAVRLLLSVLAS